MEDLAGAGPEAPWHRAVSTKWEKRQSEWLVGIIGVAVASLLGLQIFDVVGMGEAPGWFFWAVGASGGFAVLVWRMRASTGAGAALGGLICLRLLMRMRFGDSWTRTAMPELIALFVLTYGATRFGRGRVVADGAERRGRRASQVVANLGIAGLLAGSMELGFFMAGLGALAEAAADTVSSEMGQALGGRAWSVTTGREVPAGTDGGVSLVGSVCGIGAAAVVAGIAFLCGAVHGMAGLIVFGAGCAGVVLDSLLGATVERCGWFGNDLVNFVSTVFAGFLALEGARFLVGPQPYW